MAGTILLVCLVLMLGSAKAQNDPVICFMESDTNGTGDVPAKRNTDCPSEMGFNTTYAECCTGDNPEMTMYMLEGGNDCMPCGPVLDEEAIVPFAVELTTIVLQWQLAIGSLEADSFRVTNQQDGSDTVFPSSISGGNSVQFIGLNTGTLYRFTIRADNTGKGVSSPIIAVEWITGKSSFPSFINFNLEIYPENTVRVTWELESSGVRPMDQMIVRWVQLPDNNAYGVQIDEGLEFPDCNTVIFTFNETNPAIIGQRFLVDIPIEPDNQYAMEINGTNLIGSSQSFFTFNSSTLRYATCPVDPENCMEDLEVTEGNDILFDVSVTFVNGGSSGQRQVVNLLQFYKGDENGERLVLCSYANGGNCTDNMGSRIEFVQIGSNNYDLKLTLPGAMIMDAGTYTASVEAILPATGGQVYILKSFEVTVNPQVTSPTQSTLVPGPTQTVIVPTPTDTIDLDAGSSAEGLLAGTIGTVIVTLFTISSSCLYGHI